MVLILGLASTEIAGLDLISTKLIAILRIKRLSAAKATIPVLFK